MPLKVFYCYSHNDRDLLDGLRKHLEILNREGIISSWHDREIGAGRERDSEIDKHINSADIILMLVSPDFVASDYCWEIEMRRALERHKGGQVRAIPIILRPVDWGSAPFSSLIALPEDGKAVTSWANRDEAYLSVAKGLRRVCNEISRGTSAQGDPRSSAPESTRTTDKMTFCSRCGVKAGRSTECTGQYTSHSFRAYEGQPYCSRCGMKAGQSTECTGRYVAHSFQVCEGQPYCSRCGIRAGQSTECIGTYVSHSFQPYQGQPYCSRCGTKAGQSTECTGTYVSHNLREYDGLPYCSRCGVKAGQKTECTGLYASHHFVTD